MPASVIFSIRPESDLKAWHAPGGAQGGVVDGAGYTAASGAGIIGSGYLDLSTSSKIQGIYWPAAGNFPTDNIFSVLWRGAVIGSNATQNALWALNFSNQVGTVGSLFQSNTLYTDIEALTSTSDIYSDGGAWTPVLGTFYDIVWLFNIASSTSNNVKVYVNGVLLYEGDTTGNWGAGPRNNIGYDIGFGTSPYTVVAQTKINEFVIWDGIIDPTNVPLTSGNGSLNGASRTAFVQSTQLDGSSYTDPGVSNVLLTASYIFGGVTETGNVSLPTQAQVEHGVTFGSNHSLTGSYTGSDEWSDPGISNVLAGVTYLANGSTETGTLQQVTNLFGTASLYQTPAFGQTNSQITFTQGDRAVLVLYAKDVNGNPVDITNGTFSTQVLAPNGLGIVVFGNSQHTILDAVNGKFSLTLSISDTPTCGLGPNKDILTTITQSGNPVSFRGAGILTVYPEVPLA